MVTAAMVMERKGQSMNIDVMLWFKYDVAPELIQTFFLSLNSEVYANGTNRVETPSNFGGLEAGQVGELRVTVGVPLESCSWKKEQQKDLIAKVLIEPRCSLLPVSTCDLFFTHTLPFLNRQPNQWCPLSNILSKNKLPSIKRSLLQVFTYREENTDLGRRGRSGDES